MLTRRRLMVTLAAARAVAAQTPQSVPPQGVPAQPSNLDKALSDIRDASQRLQQIQIPAALEPAFTFRV